MATRAAINQFLDQKTLAIAGVSRGKNKFGNSLYKELLKKDYKLYPVNPHMETFKEVKCYADIQSLPDDVKGIVIVTDSSKTLDLIKAGEGKGIKNFWVQQGAENDEVIDYSKESKSNIVFKHCLLMFAEPVKSIHGFHRFIAKIFGKLPK